MKDTLSEVIYNDRINDEYCRIGLKTGWKKFDPGQFVMVKVPEGGAFLRRPFGIARLSKGIVELCYKVIGNGTVALSKASKKDELMVLGPIGNGFKISNLKSQIHILVAGGYGVAPLLGLAEKLKGSKTHLFYGAKNKNHLHYLKEFKKLKFALHLSTEDGSSGEKGLITNSLRKFLASMQEDERTSVRIYACGPHGMLKETVSVFQCFNVSSCQLSLESYMACGIGVCMGCVVKGADGEFIRVCKEGPVFKASLISL